MLTATPRPAPATPPDRLTPIPHRAALIHWLAKSYPDVRGVTTDALATPLAAAADGRPTDALVLIDVRTVAEQAVSTLPGALCIADEPSALLAARASLHDTPIVVYCAVGACSARAARALAPTGYTDVANLQGGIFKWASESRPLLAGGRATHVVHPYNNFWAVLLARTLRSTQTI